MPQSYLNYRTKVGYEHVTLPYYYKKVVAIERCVNGWRARWIWWRGGYNYLATCQLIISRRKEDIEPYRTITWNDTGSWLDQVLSDPDRVGLRRIDPGLQNYTVVTRWRNEIKSL